MSFLRAAVRLGTPIGRVEDVKADIQRHLASVETGGDHFVVDEPSDASLIAIATAPGDRELHLTIAAIEAAAEELTQRGALAPALAS